MTERMIEYLNYGSKLKGLILVEKFDEKVEEFLQSYEILRRNSNQRLVKDPDTEEEFLVVRVSEACRGRRTNHLILDNRIDDELINCVCLPQLVGFNRKVELF